MVSHILGILLKAIQTKTDLIEEYGHFKAYFFFDILEEPHTNIYF